MPYSNQFFTSKEKNSYLQSFWIFQSPLSKFHFLLACNNL